MSGFTKLDSGIVNSTIWVQPHDVLRVWIALLALSEANGISRTAAPALSNLCMVPVDRMREILKTLESPDEDSRSGAEGGRRIVKIEGGWWLVNHASYRKKVSMEDKREADKARVAAKRAESRVESQVVAGCRADSQAVEYIADVAQAEAEAEAEAGKNNSKEQVRSRGSRLPDDWRPSESDVQWARDKRPDLKIDDEIEMFCNHWTAKSGKDATKTNWSKTWRNWVLKAWTKGAATPKGSSTRHGGFQERAYGAGGDL